MTHDPVTRALTPPYEQAGRLLQWKVTAMTLRKKDDALQWAWGAWADRGYRDFELSYDEMAAIARKRRQTLYNRAAVHRAWPEAERVYDTLTWSHYEATYSLPKDIRKRLMMLATAYKWSVDELRIAVRQEQAALKGVSLDDRPQSFTGVGMVRIEGEYRLIVDIDPQTLNMPDWAFDGADVEITIRRRK